MIQLKYGYNRSSEYESGNKVIQQQLWAWLKNIALIPNNLAQKKKVSAY
jgi:hypothetical protein